MRYLNASSLRASVDPGRSSDTSSRSRSRRRMPSSPSAWRCARTVASHSLGLGTSPAEMSSGERFISVPSISASSKSSSVSIGMKAKRSMVAASIGARPTYSLVAPRPIVLALAMKRAVSWRGTLLSGNSPWPLASALLRIVKILALPLSISSNIKTPPFSYTSR